MWRLKAQKKNDVTRQAKFVGDYYSSKTTPKQMLAFKGTKKNDVMRQAGILGDSYSSKTTPSKYAAIHITFFKPLWKMLRANTKLT